MKDEEHCVTPSVHPCVFLAGGFGLGGEPGKKVEKAEGGKQDIRLMEREREKKKNACLGVCLVFYRQIWGDMHQILVEYAKTCLCKLLKIKLGSNHLNLKYSGLTYM